MAKSKKVKAIRNYVARDMAHKFKSKKFVSGTRRSKDSKNSWKNQEY